MKLEQQLITKMNMISYKEYIIKSIRNDDKLNEKIHWFSSLIKDPISYLFYLIRATPNQVSFLFGIIGMISIYMLYTNNILLFYIFWRLHIILDMVDGDLARVLNKKSDFGLYIDKLNHGTINPILILIICNILSDNYLISLICMFSFIYFQNTKQYSIKKQVLNPIYNMNIFTIIIKDLLIIEGLILLILINNYITPINSLIIPSIYAIIYFIVGTINVRNEFKKN